MAPPTTPPAIAAVFDEVDPPPVGLGDGVGKTIWVERTVSVWTLPFGSVVLRIASEKSVSAGVPDPETKKRGHTRRPC